MTIDPQIQSILNALIALVLSSLLVVAEELIRRGTPLILVWVDSKIELAKSHLSASQLAILDLVVTRAVQDAEQSGLIGKIGNTATAKKDYALKNVQAELDKMDIPFDVNEADRRIEAAINQGLQQSPTQLALIESSTIPNQFPPLTPFSTGTISVKSEPSTVFVRNPNNVKTTGDGVANGWK